MTVRSPLKYDDANTLQEMSSTEVSAWVDHICYLYGGSPSVTLTVDTGSAQNLQAMSDTRLQAGSTSTSTSAFVAEGTTAEPSTVTVAYDRVNQTYASISPTQDTSGTTWPVYYESSSKSIIAMSIADIKDTFLHPAIDKLITSSESDTTAGTYTITTSSSAATGYTVVDASNAVFTDTRADTSQYAAGGIPETLDQPTTVTNYYLHRRNQGSDGFASLATPLIISGDLELTAQTSQTVLDALFLEWIRETASESADGHQIVYSIGTSGGNTRGTAMVDTKLNGSGNYQQRQVGDDYRSQEFPNGSPATITTYNLRITKA